MLGWITKARARHTAKRQRQQSEIEAWVQRELDERRRFVELMIERTRAGLADWTQPIATGQGLYACHYRAHPSRLHVCDRYGRSTEYWLVDERAWELMRLVMLQETGRITMAG